MRLRASAVRRAILVAVLAATTGCGGLWPFQSVAPNGLARSDDDLRRDLATARYTDALDRVSDEGDSAPDDELLRLLYRGAVDHYSGRYAESADALDRAAALADDRYTLSASRGALSMLSSDRALQFRPTRTERLLIHYYAALDYLNLADIDGAAVEARRLSALLQRYGDDGWDCGGTQLCPALRYFAGAIFEAAGLYGDADVAYRNAGPLTDRLRPADDSAADAGEADTATTNGAGDAGGTGEVVVLLERGFVAHRVQESVNVVLGADESAALEQADEEERLELSTVIAARLLDGGGKGDIEIGDRPRQLPTVAASPDVERRGPDRRRRGIDRTAGRRPAPDDDDDDDGEDDDEEEDEEEEEDERARNPYLLRVAWPVYRDDSPAYGRARIVGPDGRQTEVATLADVSAAVMDEFDDDRLAIVARAVARAAAKMATARTVESGLSSDGSALGQVLGLLTNLGGALLEQADTRSWHLVPDAVGIARMRLPAGRHTLELEVNDSRGSGDRRVAVGPVDVRAGAITFVSARVWR